jgi:hypothetical protein
MVFNHSNHAEVQIAGRGITHEILHTFLDLADIRLPAGGSCDKITMSHARYAEILQEGIPVQKADKLKRMAVVLSQDNTVVTAMMLHKKKGKKYRRDLRCRRRRPTRRN